jgi:hypothetical protein
MKTLLKILAILAAGGLALLLLIQLVPYGRQHTNPLPLHPPRRCAGAVPVGVLSDYPVSDRLKNS